MQHKLNLQLEVVEKIGEDGFNHDYGTLDLTVGFNEELDYVAVEGLTPKGYLGIEDLESLLEDMKYLKSKQ